MNKAQYLPAFLIVINVLSAAVYFVHDDWRKATYWMAAAVLTTVVTF